VHGIFHEFNSVSSFITVGNEKKFPLLNMDGLTEQEKEHLMTQLKVESDQIQCKFQCLVCRTEKALERSDVTIDNLISFFRKFKVLASHISTTDTIPQIMRKVTDENFWTFFDYELLGGLIKTYLQTESALRDLNEYISDFKLYCERRIYEVPIDKIRCSLRNNPESKSNLCVKLDENFSVSQSVKHIKHIQHKLSQILSINFLYLIDVTDGCIKLIFRHFCEFHKIFPVSDSGKTSLTQIGVAWLHCGNYRIQLKPHIEEHWENTTGNGEVLHTNYVTNDWDSIFYAVTCSD